MVAALSVPAETFISVTMPDLRQNIQASMPKRRLGVI